MRRQCRTKRGGGIVEWSEHPEVENIGVVRACRSMAHIACTRRTETIRMQNKEEIWVVAVECD